MPRTPERYRTFWTEFGRAIKEGLLDDSDNRETLLDVARSRRRTTRSEPTTLREYVERMKDGQNDIYYVTGESRSMIENSPHMEAFRAKGYEVLLLTDPVDEVWVERSASSTASRCSRSPRARSTWTARRRGRRAGAGAAAQGLRRPADLAGEQLAERGQGGAALLPADHLAGLHRRRRRRPHPDAGEHVPGDGPGAAPGQADPGAQPDPPAGHRAAHGPRRSARTAVLAETAELLYGMALLAEGGELTTRPASPGCSPTGWPAPCRRSDATADGRDGRPRRNACFYGKLPHIPLSLTG